MHLVVVESPAKARTIQSYLGKDYKVLSSAGHIWDLPGTGQRAAARVAGTKAAAAKKRKYGSLGINTKTWDADYQLIPDRERYAKALTDAAKDADMVYLATDRDREGEAIAWHLRERLRVPKDKFRRVVFNEITKDAIQTAFSHPSDVDENQVNAQQARRFLDRFVGWGLSPLIIRRIGRGLSAGRVQSVAVRLIVERERDIRAFVPETWHEVSSKLSHDGKAMEFSVLRPGTKSQKFETEQDATDAKDRLTAAGSATIVDRRVRHTVSQPRPPFTTSTLQQVAGTVLRFPVKRTMSAAQALYEAGLITYMRTDSNRIAKEAVEQIRDMISQSFGAQYLSRSKVTRKKASAHAQEAHEAVRPTDIHVTPRDIAQTLSVRKVDSRQSAYCARLYEVIWRRSVASCMSAATFDVTTITAKCGSETSVQSDDELFMRVQGRVQTFDGWLKAGLENDVTSTQLPALDVGDALTHLESTTSQHASEPPPRYSEPTLVKALEVKGIGRPSTYATIINTVQERGYVRKMSGRRLMPTPVGELVTDSLVRGFADWLDYGFTGAMEERLDEIAHGSRDWRTFLTDAHDRLDHDLKLVEKTPDLMPSNDWMRGSDIACPSCAHALSMKIVKEGLLVAHPRAERAERGDDACAFSQVTEPVSDTEPQVCQVCSAMAEEHHIRPGRRLLTCPTLSCSWAVWRDGSFESPAGMKDILECDRCGGESHRRVGRFGPYFQCTNSNCEATRKIGRDGTVAPTRMDPVPLPECKTDDGEAHFVLREGARGLFLMASDFPKRRDSRSPLIRELQPVEAFLPEKLQWLARAPASDPDGGDATLMYDSRQHLQYVRGGAAHGDDNLIWEVRAQGQSWGDWQRVKVRTVRRRVSAK